MFPSMCRRPPSSPLACSWPWREGWDVISTCGVFFLCPRSLRARPGRSPLSASASTLPFPLPLSSYGSPLCRLLLVLSGMGRNFGAPHQTLTGHAVGTVPMAVATRGLAGRLIPAFVAGAAGMTASCAGAVVFAAGAIPSFFSPFRIFYLDRDGRSFLFAILVCDSLYC